MHKFRSIQVLRAVAACAVAYLHCSQNLGAGVGREGYGAFGVDLFFVISGFIMAQVSQGRSAAGFIRDRLWRIYPLWWIALLPWLLLLPRGPLVILSSLSLWPIYGGNYYVPVLQVGWTLSFELLFYLGMACAILARAWGPLCIYGALLLGALTTSSATLHFVGNPLALEFLLGVVVARLPRRPRFAVFALAGIAAVMITTPGTGSARSTLLDPAFALWRVFQWGLPAALIVWGVLSSEAMFRRRLFDGPVVIGDASYSIYLVHPLVAYGLDLAWPLKLAAAIAAGLALHFTVETRIMGLARGLRHRTVVDQPATA